MFTIFFPKPYPGSGRQPYFGLSDQIHIKPCTQLKIHTSVGGCGCGRGISFTFKILPCMLSNMKINTSCCWVWVSVTLLCSTSNAPTEYGMERAKSGITLDHYTNPSHSKFLGRKWIPRKLFIMLQE